MARTVNLKHARTDFQRDVMKRIKKDKVCPFCEEHFLKYHTKPIIKRGKHWILTENFQPYEGTKHHLLAVARKHVTSFTKLSPAAHTELLHLFKLEAEKRGIKGGALFMRFGDTDFTGGSVEHLHAQLIAGAKRGAAREGIPVYLGYKATSKAKPAQSRHPRP